MFPEGDRVTEIVNLEEFLEQQWKQEKYPKQSELNSRD